jgi:LPXTG-motif cell wall-anchored protein
VTTRQESGAGAADGSRSGDNTSDNNGTGSGNQTDTDGARGRSNVEARASRSSGAREQLHPARGGVTPSAADPTTRTGALGQTPAGITPAEQLPQTGASANLQTILTAGFSLLLAGLVLLLVARRRELTT